MRLRSRILTLVMILLAPAPARAVAADPDPQSIARPSPAAPDAAPAALSAADSLAAARLGVTAGAPDGRYAHVAILDPPGRRMLVHGGFTFPPTNSFWELTLEGMSDWSPVPQGAVAAPTLGAHVAIHDPVRRRMLIFGGSDQVGRRNDTWSYALDSGLGWAQLAVDGTPPVARTLHCGIYDPVRDRLVVFGGYRDNAYLNDVWALSLSGTPTWSQLSVAGTPPAPRRECSAIYDPVRDRMVIFGGTDGNPSREVWALNLSPTPSWTLLTSDPGGPSARSGQSAIYDPARDVMWMFAGRDGGGNILNDLWTLTLSGTPAWVAMAPIGPPPGLRVYHSAIMDAQNDRMIVFSGYNGGLPNDTWFLQLGGTPTWYPLGSEPPTPPTRPDPWFESPASTVPATIELGQSFVVSVTVRNRGVASDDGVISMSFPSLTDPGDGQLVESASTGDSPGYAEFPAGSELTGADCQPVTAAVLAVEYRDDAWDGFGTEANPFAVTVRPRSAGTFYIDVRSTMRVTGSACDYVNALPPGGTGALLDQQGWAVRRFAVTVLDTPAPAFLSLDMSPAVIELGQSFTITTTVRNTGAASDDGRIAFSFPALTDPADAQWVSSASAGDTPGYLEHPAGAPLTDAACQPVTASYLAVEYADGAWGGLGTETNAFVLTVRPPTAGTFHVYVRATMHKTGTVCDLANATPLTGIPDTDQQGWAVRRITVTVLDAPAPAFVGLGLVPAVIELGQAFTITATVGNTGATSDDGRISFSFPALTDPADAQWVSSASAGDTPGYLEHPAGAPLTDAACQPVTASYLAVEYADGAWGGLGTEVNTFAVTVQPTTAGTFYVDVRSTLRKPGAACELVNAVPSTGTAGFLDQQGWAVRRFSVTVLDAPIPVFTSSVVLSANSIALGQSLTITSSVRNDGAAGDGRIAFSFPGLTGPSDHERVSSTSAGDLPGYLEHPAGSTLADAACQPVMAAYVLAEYQDESWGRLGSETNTLAVTVMPREVGTFHIYVRATMQKAGPGPCAPIVALPQGGDPGFTDQQGFAVKRFSVTVNPAPPPPIPLFTRFQILPTSTILNTLTLGQSINILVDVRNDGGWSDDGRVVFSFPVPCAVTMPGTSRPAGSTLLDSGCQPVVTTYPVWEYADPSWDTGEVHSIQVTITPQSAGTFYFDVRSTMHATGTACEYANSGPSTGAAAADEQGWAVRRITFDVRPNIPAPVFTAPVTWVPASITFGSSFTLSTTLRNEGVTSPDGRLVVGFPQLNGTADAAWVSNGTGGDSPGYREYPAGSQVTTASCQSVTAPHLIVEYADQSWGGHDGFGAENLEQNSIVLTVTPQTVGDFVIEVRGSMRQSLVGCTWVNGLPAGGEGGFTDPAGWPVKRFHVQVIPPVVTVPDPTFTQPVELSATTIAEGEAFTLRAILRNDGADSDLGIISVSFPTLTGAGDAQWVDQIGAGDDTPGYQEIPTGSVFADVGCYYAPAAYLAVEYADTDWRGVANGLERNELMLSIRPPVPGTFQVYVRGAMHEPGGGCAYRSDLPSNGQGGFIDQQGWPVKRFTVTVVAAPPTLTEPIPNFVYGPAGLPGYITLGQSFTLTMSVRNDGLASDDGRISVSFPAFTSPGDDVWVSATSPSTDTPGYQEHPAGSPLLDPDCQTSPASYLVVEYGDQNWSPQGAEINALTLVVTPREVGVFTIDVRTTMHRLGGPPCDLVLGLPGGGTGAFIDQQGLAVRRYEVGVFTIPEPGAPTVTWNLIAPPAGGPGARYGASLALDEARDELFLYGGANVAYFSDIWSLPLAGGAAWNRILPGGSVPVRRIMHSSIHNPVEGHFVFFGGFYVGLIGDLALLALRPVPWWFAIPAAGPAPSPRLGHASVYDPLRHRMLTIGGYDGAFRNDVWEYRLPGNGTWTRLEPLGPQPPARAQHTAIYDPARDRVIVFGGDGGTFLNDVWELTLGVTPAWRQISVSSLPPSPRREHTMIYDPDRDRVIVFGGFDGARRNDLWALWLSGSPRWETLYSTTTAPAPRTLHGAVYDRLRRRMLMFGGQMGTNSYSGEMWSLVDNGPTPVQASRVSAETSPDRVRLTWSVASPTPFRTEVHRSAGESEGWTVLGVPELQGDRLVYEDRDVAPGSRLGYRLVELEPGGETVLDEVWVTIPRRVGLSLAGASPNPTEGSLHVTFSLPTGGAAALELFDLRGRLLARREVGALGAGEHRVLLEEAHRLRAGVYLVRLVRADQVLTAKAAVVR